MDDALKLKKATHNLWTFVVSKFISALGSSVYSFGISFYILSVTGSSLNFAINLICSLLPRTIFGPIAGALADRYSKKKMVIIGQIGETVAVTGLLVYIMLEGLSLPAIYLTTVCVSIAATFNSIAFTSSIANLVDKERIQKAMAFNQTSLSLATIGGPVIGGFLYGFTSIEVFLSIFVIAFIIATLLDTTMDFRLYSKMNHDEARQEKLLTNIKEGVAYIRKQELILRIVVVSLFINFFFGAFEIGMSYILIGQLGIQSQHFGFIEASIAVGMILMSIFIGIRKPFSSPLTIAKWGIISMGLITGLFSMLVIVDMSYWGIVVYSIILLLSLGLLVVLVNTPIGVMMQTKVEEEFRGRVFSLLETMAMALMPLAMIIFGVLYEYVPSEYILIVSSIALIIVVFVLVPQKLVQKFSEEGKEELVKKPVIDV